jgi:hypothetical protein
MFLQDADMTCLRQGDILANMIYPLMFTQDVRFVGVMDVNDLENQPPSFQVHSQPYKNLPSLTCLLNVRIGYAAIISNCCDIEPNDKNQISRTLMLALARLIPVPDSIKGDNLESLKANKNPLSLEGGPGHINRFYIPTHERLEGRDWMVDYNQVLSLSSSDLPNILKRKILQMDDESRIRFKLKIQTSFGRLSPEELASGHPWLAEPTAPEPPTPQPPAT